MTNKLWDPKKPMGDIRLLDVEPKRDFRSVPTKLELSFCTPVDCPMCRVEKELKLRALEVSRWADDGGAT